MNVPESLTYTPVMVLFEGGERSPAGSSVQEISCSSLVFQAPVVRNLWSWCWCITPEMLTIQLMERDGLTCMTTLCWMFTFFSTRQKGDYWPVQRIIRQLIKYRKSSRNTVNTPASDVISTLNCNYVPWHTTFDCCLIRCFYCILLHS